MRSEQQLHTDRLHTDRLHTEPLLLPLRPLPRRAPVPRPLPAPRATLVLVEEEEPRAPLAAQLAPTPSTGMTWVVAGVVVVAMAAGLGVAWISSRPAEVAQGPGAVATTTLNAAAVPAKPTAVAKAPAVGPPVVPELDVNSLPAAPPSTGRAR